MSNEEFTVTGRVDEISASVVERGYTERLVVVTVDGRYPQTYPIRFSDKTGSAAAKLDGVNVGDEIAVGFDIRSRKPKDRWFTNLDGWKVEIKRQAGGKAQQPRDTRRDDRPPPQEYDGPPPPTDDDTPEWAR